MSRSSSVAGADLTVQARDGHPLAATLHRAPSGDVQRCVVIVNGAMAVERRFYAPFAAFLATRGFDVITYDYRGIGGSRPASLRDFAAPMSDWGTQDLASMIDYARRELHARAIAAVGHSAGGQIIGLADNNAHVSAVLLVASQGGYWKLWSGLGRARMAFYMYVLLPAVARVLGHVPRALLGADVPGSIIREWARWCRTEDYLLGGEGATRRPGYARVRAPLLALSFNGDFYAPRAAVEWLLRQYDSATVTHRHLTSADVDAQMLDHFGFFKPSAEPTLWHYAATWLALQTS